MLIVCIVLFCLLPLGLSAQSIGSASLECIYDYRYVLDTTAHFSLSDILTVEETDKVVNVSQMVLYTGGTVSQYMSRKRYMVDSTKRANPGIDSKSLPKIMAAEPFEIIYKNFQNHDLIFMDRMGAARYKIEEPFISFDWVLLDQQKEIGGYVVKSASCTFRGRNYIAWYAPDIPVADGPWKFSGLPGLVMEVYDDKYEYYYGLKGIRSVDRPLFLSEGDYEKMNLEKYYYWKRLHIQDNQTFMQLRHPGAKVMIKEPDGKLREFNEKDKVTMLYDFQEKF